MPLDPGALEAIRRNLLLLAAGQRAPMIVIGRLTAQQHGEINVVRRGLCLPPLLDPEIVYIGRHHFESRSRDGYVPDDMLAQIRHGLSKDSVVFARARMTSIQNLTPRPDGYGNLVRDQAIFELTARKPRAELFSVIPKGDGGGPNAQKARPEGRARGDSPG